MALLFPDLKEYNKKPLTVGVLGSHSALEISFGAKSEGLKNLVISEKGREKTYADHYKYDPITKRGCVDEVLILDSFKDMLTPAIQEAMLSRGVLFVPHRSFEVYVCQDDYSVLEHGTFPTPILGNRALLVAEERFVEKNQYYLLEKSGVPFPQQFSSPQDIDRLVIVKVPEKTRKFERGFFLAKSYQDFSAKAEMLVENDMITEASLKDAVIEEFVIGPVVNLNFFYSPLTQKLELLGTDMRRQTNMDGIFRLPAWQQLELADSLRPKFEEAGHIACTILESMVERVYELGERFVATVKEEFSPGIIGPFALQCAIKSGPPKKDFVCFDVSLRVPGSPGIAATPYSSYLWGEPMSIGS
jgi:5-formaminoimidazole-4-carboxamide-1-(beta)-D-ribofuranosyl 5'-monophosphate synthetase